MDNNTKVTQFGLWSDNQQEIRNLAERVARFNQRFTTGIVLDITPTDTGDVVCDHAHAKLMLTFDSPEVQEKFWLE